MQTLQQQLDEVEALITAEKAKGANKDQAVLDGLEQRQAVILMQMDDAKVKAEQEQAAQLRIQDATEQAAYFLDNLVIEGMTMRELCAGEAEYQVLKISVQNKIINMAEESSRLLAESQAEDAARQNELKKQNEILQKKVEEESKEAAEDHETIRQLRSDLAQSQLESKDFESKLKNATAEIDRLNSQVDDLRKEIAVGARNAYKVTDVEQTQQLKQLADQIKASRIHVYDVTPDSEINPKNYTAKRADTGEEVTYNWTQSKNYIEIKDAAEVERFRNEHTSNQEANADSSLGHEETPNVTPEVTFPEVPTAQAPVIPGEIQVVVPTPELSGQGQTVEERLSALEAHVFGYVKQAVA